MKDVGKGGCLLKKVLLGQAEVVFEKVLNF